MKRSIIFLLKWILIFFVISISVFVTVRMVPVSPAEMLLQNYALPQTDENIEIINKMFGLDKNIITQYIIWVKEFLIGNWGYSYLTKLPIKQELLKRLPYSLTIGLGGILSASIFSFFLGYFASLKENGIVNKFTRIFAIFSQTIPAFILSIIVIYFIGVKLKLVKFFTGDRIYAIFFATFFVCLYQTASLTRVVVSYFNSLKDETYIKFYISRGFNPNYVLLRHGYKPVIYGLISVIISKFSWVIGGTTVVEFAFGVPGISNFLVTSMTARDYNVIQSYIMFLVLWMFMVHLIFDFILNSLNIRKNL